LGKGSDVGFKVGAQNLQAFTRKTGNEFSVPDCIAKRPDGEARNVRRLFQWQREGPIDR